MLSGGREHIIPVAYSRTDPTRHTLTKGGPCVGIARVQGMGAKAER